MSFRSSFLQFKKYFFAIASSPILAGVVFVAAPSVNNAAGTYTWDGAEWDKVLPTTLGGSETFAVNNSDTGEVLTSFDGSGTLNKTGLGTLLLSATNTYTGRTNINEGTLKFGADNALGSTSLLTIASGTTLDLNGKTQQMAGSVTSNAGSTLNFNGGTLSGTGTALWVLDGLTNLGTNSTLETAGALTIGSSGTTAKLKAGAGSKISATTLNIASTTASTGGLVEIDGTNARATFSGPVYVGANNATNSEGALKVINGGQLELTTGSLSLGGSANNTTGNGSLYIEGENSEANIKGFLFIGVGGTGYAEVTDGGKLTVEGTLKIGDRAGSNGELHLSGDDSSVNAIGGIYIGAGGNGTVTVKDGATLESGSSITLARGIGNQGTLTVENGGYVKAATTVQYGGEKDGVSVKISIKGTPDALSTLETGKLNITKDTEITFDGGILLATAGQGNAGNSFLAGTAESQSIVIGNGGMFIDSNTTDVADNASAKLSGTGTLTKWGEGKFTHNGTGTYTGGTEIDRGTFVLATKTDNSQNSIGTGTLNIAAGATAAIITASPTKAYEFANTLTGKGSFEVNLANVTDQFSISGDHSAFTGTAKFQKSTYTLANGDFANASVISAAGNTLTVGAGKNTVVNYTFDGGTTRFDLSENATDPLNAAGWIDTGTLALNSGRVQIDPTQINAAVTGVPLLQQDDANITRLLIAATDVIGNVGDIRVVDFNNAAVKGGKQNVEQNNAAIDGNSGIVAISYYGASLTTGENNDGLYLDAGFLSEIELLTETNGEDTIIKTTVLSGDTGSGGGADEFHAKITGDGHLWIDATDTITINQALNGNNTYTGGTTIGSGTLAITYNRALGTGDVIYTNGTRLYTADTVTALSNNITTNTSGVKATFETAGDLTHTGKISGGGNLTHIGAGTLTLNGSGDYSGTFTTDSAILNIVGDYSEVTGRTTISGTSASLHGTGILGGDLFIANGATFTPGQDARDLAAGQTGIFTVNGNVTLEAGATIVFDLAAPNNIALLAMNGGLFDAGGSSLDFSTSASYMPQLDDRFNLVSGVGSISSNGFGNLNWDETIAINGADFKLIYEGSTISLISLSTVPEPGTYVLLIGSLSLAFVAFRRWRKKM